MADLYYMQGNNKIRMEDLPPEAWRFITGVEHGENTPQEIYGRTAFLFRAVNARSDAASSIPFRLENRRGRAVETSDDWQGGLGYLPNPRVLIRQFMMSMDFTNQTYARVLKNRYKIVKGLQYFLPYTIKAIFDSDGNLEGFERTVKGNKFEIPTDEMFYAWKQDAFTETGASPYSPVKAALKSAGVLGNLDMVLETFFAQGALDPIIGAIPRATPPDERERAENILNSALTGIRNFFKIKLIATEDVKLQPLRTGLDFMKNNTMTQEQRENVCVALGVPLSFMLGNQANFATATQEEKTLIRWGVQPSLELLYSELSRQLYQPLGYTLKPDFDSLEMFQEEEKEKTAAANSLMDLSLKAKTKEQLQAVIDVMGIDAKPEQVQALFVESTPQPEQTQVKPIEDDVKEDEVKPKEVNTKALVELGRWEKKSVTAGKLVTWHTMEIPEDARRHILDADDWQKAFGDARGMLAGQKQESSEDIKALADAINKLANSESKSTQPMTFNMPAINLTTQMPQQGTVTVNVPEQAAPIVNVSAPNVTIEPAINNIEVKPADAVIENNIEVKPADVKIPRAVKENQTVKRNYKGEIEGSETTIEYKD